MKCPVCKQECSTNEVCPECGFNQLNPVFLNSSDLYYWHRSVVLPYRAKYLFSKQFDINDGVLRRYYGTEEHVQIPYGVTKIARGAFARIASIKSVSIPDTVLEIDSFSFAKCPNLSEVFLPNGIQKLKEKAFHICPSLRNLNIPASVLEIEPQAFSTDVLSVDFQSDSYFSVISGCVVDVVNKRAIHVLPDGKIPETEAVNAIGSYSLVNLKGKDIIIPDNITRLENSALAHMTFSRHKAKTKLVLSKRLEYIGDRALSLNGYEEIIIPESVTYIGEYAFANTLVSQIVIPDNVEHIGNWAFSNCRNLYSIVVLPTNKKYYSKWNCIIDKTAGAIIAACNGSVIPKETEVKIINSGAFSGCKNMEHIDIPINIKEIEPGAFVGMNGIRNVTCHAPFREENNCIIDKRRGEIVAGFNCAEIPQKDVCSIGRLAFYHNGLKGPAIIPLCIYSIGESAFSRDFGRNTSYDEDDMDFRVFCEHKSKPERFDDNWIEDAEDADLIFWRDEWHYDEDGKPCPN